MVSDYPQPFYWGVRKLLSFIFMWTAHRILKIECIFPQAPHWTFFLEPGSDGLLVLPKFLVSLCPTNISYLLNARLLKHFTCHFRVCAHGSHPTSLTVESMSSIQKQVQDKTLHLRQCKLSSLVGGNEAIQKIIHLTYQVSGLGQNDSLSRKVWLSP